jgi:hypothetical protein
MTLELSTLFRTTNGIPATDDEMIPTARAHTGTAMHSARVAVSWPLMNPIEDSMLGNGASDACTS